MSCPDNIVKITHSAPPHKLVKIGDRWGYIRKRGTIHERPEHSHLSVEQIDDTVLVFDKTIHPRTEYTEVEWEEVSGEWN
jgi:hypothetical protein